MYKNHSYMKYLSYITYIISWMLDDYNNISLYFYIRDKPFQPRGFTVNEETLKIHESKTSSFPPWASWGNTSSHIAAAGSLDTFSSSLRANTSPVRSWNFFALHKNVRSRDNKYNVVSYGHWSFSDNQNVAVNFCCYLLEPRSLSKCTRRSEL